MDLIMLRGKTLFICTHCWRIFKSWDIEEGGTVFTMPMPCPKCGKKCHEFSLVGLVRLLKEKIK